MNCLTCGALLDWSTTEHGTEYETCQNCDLTGVEADGRNFCDDQPREIPESDKAYDPWAGETVSSSI
jgi:hypothetical protein